MGHSYGTTLAKQSFLQLNVVHSFWYLAVYNVFQLYLINVIIVIDVDFKIKGTSMYNQPPIGGIFIESGSIIVSVSVYMIIWYGKMEL